MGFKSGQIPDQSNKRMFFSPQKFLTILFLRQVAPSCMKMLHWSTDIRISKFFFSIDTFFSVYGHYRRQIVDYGSTSSWHIPKPSELGVVSLYERCMSCGAVFRTVAKHVACEHETVALKISQKTAPCTSPLMSSCGELWHCGDASLSSRG